MAAITMEKGRLTPFSGFLSYFEFWDMHRVLTLTPVTVNVPAWSKNCLRTYCILLNPEYNSLI